MGSEITATEALNKARKYCAAQERCTSKVESKLVGWKVDKTEIDEIVRTLKSEGFLNDERFAILYARSKFNASGWGKMKIFMMLKGLNIPKELIEKAVKEIDADSYEVKLIKLLEKKEATIKSGTPDIVKKQKLFRFAASKGFELQLIHDALEKIEL